MKRVRFIIVGSGWRAMYYVRIAKALPEQFELCALLCRTQEKADRIAAEYGIVTTTSIAYCLEQKPDYAVVVVDKAHIAEVAMEWMDRGIPVMMETPAAMDMETLERLKQQKGKLVVAEQYRRYPENIARLNILKKGLIAEPDYLYLSMAHEYHGASLIRAFLQVPADMPFSITAFEWAFPTVETLSRYERFTDGHTADKKRMAAVIRFDNGKVCLYDFDSEQYRSPIRKNLWKLQGSRGEINDDVVYWLDSENQGRTAPIVISARTVETDSDNPNFTSYEEVTAIKWNNETVYEPPFGLCGLSQDETAIASLMNDMGAYARGEAESPYPLEEALQDAYMAILLRQAASEGTTVHSTWNVK